MVVLWYLDGLEYSMAYSVKGENMPARDSEIAKELKQRLLTKVRIVDFRLFGSRARGDASEYSDMDVFLEVEELDAEIKNEIMDVMWEVGFDHGIVIAPLIFTRNEIEKTALRSSQIVKNILEEGVSL